jgi:putative peptidoglycan lipid II flippase
VGPGSVASLDYARLFTETSHTLLVVPLGFIGLSHFSAMALGELHRQVDRHLARIFLIFLPLSAFLFVNGEWLLRLVYLRGAFDAESLATTHRALTGLSVGLWLYSGSFFLARVFNARLRNGVVLGGEALFALASALVMILSYQRLGLLGLGLATSLGAGISLLYYRIRLGAALPLSRRCLVLLTALLPIYLLAAWLLLRWRGDAVGFALQVALAVGLWGAALLRAELRALLRRAADGGEEGDK